MLGFRRIPEDERWIIEEMGKFQRQAGPGLIWLVPVSERVREKVSVREMRLPLFQKPIKIDFTNGSAAPKEAYAFVAVLNPDKPDKKGETGCYKLIYRVEDWRGAATALIEDAVRSYLTGLTIEEGLESERLGYNLLDDRLPEEEVKALKKSLANWGLKLTKVTIGDLDLDPAILKAREDVFRKQKEREMASFEKEIRAQKDIGAYILSLAETHGMTEAEVQAKIAASTSLSKEHRRFTQELIRERMAIDGNSFMRIVSDNAALDIIALLGRYFSRGSSPGGPPQPPGESKAKTSKTKKHKIGGEEYDVEFDDEGEVSSFKKV